MEGELVGTAYCNDCLVKYYLIEQNAENGRRRYGVAVEFLGELTAVPAIAAAREQTEVLLEALRRGCVTPVTVRDVVEDWLADSSCNFA